MQIRSPLSHSNKSTYNEEALRSFLSYCLERATLLFSLKMALIIGSILALINHGLAIITGHLTLDGLISMCLTYCVPFSVSLYSQVQGKRQRDHLYAATQHNHDHQEPAAKENIESS